MAKVQSLKSVMLTEPMTKCFSFMIRHRLAVKTVALQIKMLINFYPSRVPIKILMDVIFGQKIIVDPMPKFIIKK